MSVAARIYVAAIIAAGALAAALQLSTWEPENWPRFAGFLILSSIGSSFKVSLPGVTGTMSVAFLFVLIAVVQLSPSEALVLAAFGGLLQCYWRAKRRPPVHQVVFNLADSCLCAVCASAVYHHDIWESLALGKPVVLAASALVYFVINTAPVAVIIALTENRSPRRVWQECYFWSFPYYLVGASIAGLFDAAARRFGWEALVTLFPVVILIYRSYRVYLGRLESERAHAEEMASLHLRTIEALALAIDAKDHTTHDHLQRVQVYAVAIARELNLPDEQISAIQAASLLHDIGKLAVPEHIISKPGKLTAQEFEKMKIHPVVGAEILDRVKFPYPVVPIVRSHHEKWNGTGYPDGLKGEEIPIGARILTAVDCLDALASDRQYRRALPLDEAMQVIVADAGKSFDPEIVTILQRRYRELELLARSGPAVTELGRLSKDAIVTNGDSPGAGLEVQEGPGGAEFTASIAAARHEAQSLLELARDVGNSLSLREALPVVATRLNALIAYDALAIYILEDGKLKPEFVTGQDSRLFSSLEIPVGQGLSGWVAENYKPIVNGNPSVEPGYLNDESKFSSLNSALAVPLEGCAGIVGVLALYRSAHEAFTRDQLRILEAISSKLSLSIDNALKFRQAETGAARDYLTGLPNARSLFIHLDEELSRARRAGSSLAVIVSDLDGFKQVNDRFGHLIGNQVLTAVASKLSAACQEPDYVARLGGDEFVIVIRECSPETLHDRIAALGEIVRSAGFEVCGEQVIAMSFGAAYFPADAADTEALLGVADRAMYQSKKARVRERPAPPGPQDLVALAAHVAKQPARVGDSVS